MCLCSRTHTPSNPGSPGCYDLPQFCGDTNKSSMTCLSGWMQACVGHSHREGFDEAPSAVRELPGQVLLENKPAQRGH